MEKVFFIIPTYNDYQQLPSITRAIIEKVFACVVVDDGSDIAQMDTSSLTQIYFLRHKENLGQGAALQTGFEFAILKGAQVLVSFDADGQHSLEDAQAMLKLLKEQQLDMVLGSRFLDKQSIAQIPPSRYILLRLARSFNNLITGLKLSDVHNGLRVMRSSCIQRRPIQINRMGHATEILYGIKKNQWKYQEYSTYITYSNDTHKDRGTFYISKIIWDLVYLKIYRANYKLEFGLWIFFFLYSFGVFQESNHWMIFNLVAFLFLVVTILYRKQKSHLLKKTVFIRKQAIQNARKL